MCRLIIPKVRGAYMTSEKRRSHILTRPNPVHDKIESTHDSYNKYVEHFLSIIPQIDYVCHGLLWTRRHEGLFWYAQWRLSRASKSIIRFRGSSMKILKEAERLALKGTPLKRGSVTVGNCIRSSSFPICHKDNCSEWVMHWHKKLLIRFI